MLKTGNSNTQRNFSIDDPKEFAKQTKTKRISVDGFFKNVLKTSKNPKRKTKISMFFTNKFNRTSLIHSVL